MKESVKGGRGDLGEDIGVAGFGLAVVVEVEIASFAYDHVGSLRVHSKEIKQ